PAIRTVLERFDQIFAVLEDRDEEITRWALEWAKADGHMDRTAAHLMERFSLSDAEIDALVAEREQARRSRNFSRADAIRKELAEKSIVLEDSKEGVRWKRK
ncbi:MAG TPA: cysteine--tRNA ligase, partial [Acidobacteriaceae bacterium]|nr:cysteine--tRNA ligase [Acidobacteriaceae bacterium]